MNEGAPGNHDGPTATEVPPSTVELASHVSRIAHDVNNMLLAVRGQIEIALRGSGGDPRLGTALGEARDAAQRAIDLGRELLALARTASPPRTLPPTGGKPSGGGPTEEVTEAFERR